MLEWEDIHFSDEGYLNADQKNVYIWNTDFSPLTVEKDLFDLLLKPLKDSD